VKIFKLIFLLLICSCSSSSLRGKNFKDDSLKQEEKEVSLNFYGANSISQDNVDYWKEQFVKGFIYGPEIVVNNKNSLKLVENNQENKCKVKVIFSDDSNSLRSAKTWISGLSLFVIPMKFNTKFEVHIQMKEREKDLIYEVDTWKSLFLIPFFPLTTSKESIVRKIGNDVSNQTRKICKN